MVPERRGCEEGESGGVQGVGRVNRILCMRISDNISEEELAGICGILIGMNIEERMS